VRGLFNVSRHLHIHHKPLFLRPKRILKKSSWPKLSRIRNGQLALDHTGIVLVTLIFLKSYLQIFAAMHVLRVYAPRLIVDPAYVVILFTKHHLRTGHT